MKMWAHILGFLLVVLFLIGILLRNPVLVYSGSVDLAVQPSPELLKSHVESIVKVEPFRNHSNVFSLDKVADYILENFNKFCPEVRFQNFAVEGKDYKNVLCFFRGDSRKRIVIGAHYDVFGEQNGADYNGSGVAGIIELARLLKENKSKISQDVDIVAYTLEEPPHFRAESMGSFFHAKSLKEKDIEIEFMLSVEMIGYFSDEWWSQRYPSPFLYLFYPVKGNFITLISSQKEYFSIRALKKAFNKSMNIPLYSLSAPAFIPGVDSSDHLNYWEFGYDGYMLTDTSFYRNTNYHKKTDSIETLDFEKMAEVVKGLYGLVTSYSQVQ